MKIAELRELLERHDAKSLRLLALELYRAVPAKLREASDLDHLARDPAGWVADRKTSGGRAAPTIDPFSLLDEASTFLEHASEQHYFASNRFIPKRERTQWRFVAKRVYRSLLALGADAEQ